MNSSNFQHADVLRDLGDGLILRRSEAGDADALAQFHAGIHLDPPRTEPDDRIAAWVLDLSQGGHPTFGVGDFTIVEDTRTGKIVSSLNLISQRWSYGGICFGVGRPELVATDAAYRNRGLIRAQFEVVHQWSAARGELVQGITGIPYYYRQFGYEMAMLLGGGRMGYLSSVPVLKEGESEPYRFRPVTEGDLPFVLEVDARAAERSLVTCVRDLALWRYEVFGKRERNVDRLEFRIIERSDGRPVGILGHAFGVERGRLGVMFLELHPGASWLSVTPSLLRYLKATGEAYAARDGGPFERLAFWLGPEHPLFRVTYDRLPDVRRPYAWYLRVTNLPGFIRLVAPVLEARLARSLAVGHTGEIKLSFYRTGLRLAFEQGRLAAAEAWQPSPEDEGAAGFPGLTFLQLLFGYRSLEELRAAFADCWWEGDDARALIEALFPKQASHFWMLS